MDKISIENLAVFAKHGVLGEEKTLGQKFLVSAVLYTDTRESGLYDKLDKTIDYSQVCKYIYEYVSKTSYNLIEALAENLAMALLKEIRGLKKIDVTISKPWAPVGLYLDNLSISISRSWHTAYLSIGSNLGDRDAFLNMAVDTLENDESCYVSKVADYIETKPYGNVSQPDFLNGCIELKTLYTPMELLKVCQSIENAAGRTRTIKWGPRTLDIDILFYDNEIIYTKELMIPHPQIPLREFVLKPLVQIAPYIMHPILHKSATQLLECLEQDRP